MNFRTQYNYKKSSPNFGVYVPLVEVIDFDTTIEPNSVKAVDNKGSFTNTDTPVSPFPQSAVSLNLNPHEVGDFFKNVMQTEVKDTSQNE